MLISIIGWEDGKWLKIFYSKQAGRGLVKILSGRPYLVAWYRNVPTFSFDRSNVRWIWIECSDLLNESPFPSSTARVFISLPIDQTFNYSPSRDGSKDVSSADFFAKFVHTFQICKIISECNGMLCGINSPSPGASTLHEHLCCRILAKSPLKRPGFLYPSTSNLLVPGEKYLNGKNHLCSSQLVCFPDRKFLC